MLVAKAMEFTLLHGGLALGAALAVIPVVLHLILRQKPKQLVFPALQLIKLRHRANRRRLRLRHLLLLLLRMAVIAAMALTLARPRLGGVAGADQEAPVAAVFVFDTSLSMHYRYENATRLEKAQQLALELLRRLPESSKVAILESGTRILRGSGPLDEPQPLSNWSANLAAVQDQILGLEPLPTSRAMSSALAEAFDRLADPTLGDDRRELYVFSDLTVGGWSAQGAAALDAAAENVPNLAAYVLDVGVEQPKNFAISELSASRQILLPGGQVMLRATVEAVGEPGQRLVELYLGRDEQDRPMKLRDETIELAAGESRQVQWILPSLDVGVHQGRVQLVGGADGLGHDDRHYLTLEVRPRLDVLLVGTGEADTVYWQGALTPSDELSSYDVDQVAPDAITPALLRRYAVVCLINVPTLSEPDWNALASYVSDGGGLALLPGPDTQPENFDSKAAQQLAPARIAEQGVTVAEPPVYLAPQGLGHPIVQTFQQWPDEQNWQYLLVNRYFATERAADAEIVIPYNNRDPALLERTVGKGRVLMLTTSVSDQPAANRWNELTSLGPGLWMFLVLADQMTQHLAGYTDERVNYLADEPTVRLRLPSDERPNGYLLRSPAGRQEQGQIDPAAREIVLAVPSELGNFQVTGAARGPAMRKGFSVNASPQESRLERISLSELDAVFGEEGYSLARDADSLNIALRQARQGMEIFPLLIAMMVLLLAGEAFTAGRFYPDVRQTLPQRRHWEQAAQLVVALLGITLGVLAGVWAVYKLLESTGQTERPTPWLYRFGELALGLCVLAVGAVFAWRSIRFVPKLLVRLRAVWRRY